MKYFRGYLLVIVSLFVYIISVYFRHSRLFHYQFQPTLIHRYFLSQDIPYEPNGKRLFLSDGEIHQAAGYLYWHGESPAEINFQHPPLIKYLFGISIILLKNPLWVQFVFALVMITATFALAKIVTRSFLIALLASTFLAADPLLTTLSNIALLDLGQATFLLFYVILTIKKTKAWWVTSGLVLGLAAASKFWAGSLFFIFITLIFSFVKNKKLGLHFAAFKTLISSKSASQLIKGYFYQVVIAGVVFSLVYLPTIVVSRGRFNLLFFELKTVKYWFCHSISVVPFASLAMFFIGKFRAWWGSQSILMTPSWWLFWPLSLTTSSIFGLVKIIKTRRVTNLVFISLLPISYLFYIAIQAPFERYFIIILPFVYIGFAVAVVKGAHRLYLDLINHHMSLVKKLRVAK